MYKEVAGNYFALRMEVLKVRKKVNNCRKVKQGFLSICKESVFTAEKGREKV
jgi:hypothetical protein